MEGLEPSLTGLEPVGLPLADTRERFWQRVRDSNSHKGLPHGLVFETSCRPSSATRCIVKELWYPARGSNSECFLILNQVDLPILLAGQIGPVARNRTEVTRSAGEPLTIQDRLGVKAPTNPFGSPRQASGPKIYSEESDEQ